VYNGENKKEQFCKTKSHYICKMNVLIGCEYSGIVRDEFKAKGHNAWSCDILPTERPGNHYQCDVIQVLHDQCWDLLIAFPPCTYLAKVQSPLFKKQPDRAAKRVLAFEFVKSLWNAPIKKIAIENPPGWLSTNWMKPSQTIQPYYFGDNDLKETNLWLKGLPRLNGLHHVAANKKHYYPKPYKNYPSGRPQYFSGKMDDGNKKLRGLNKAKTFPGIAAAMAKQWG
jgi:hypothetical protein